MTLTEYEKLSKEDLYNLYEESQLEISELFDQVCKLESTINKLENEIDELKEQIDQSVE